MAIRIDHIAGDGNIKVVARIDGALDYEEEAYSAYLKTLDEGCLKFKEGVEPTRFVLRKTIPYKVTQRIKANQIRMDKKDVYFNTSTTGEEVRYALVDIENPAETDGTPLKYDGTKVDDGKGGSITIASETTMNMLSQLNIVDDLYAARRNFVEGGGQNLKKS